MVKLLVPVIAALIFGVPTLLAGLPALSAEGTVLRAVLLAIAPVVFVLSFLLVSGGLSRLFQKAIVRGKFPRDLKHSIYGPRRLYGLCWTALYYCSPVYYLILTVPTLRRIAFRLFGYKGDLEFTVYPDTWIRDLPLLSLGKGAYLSNKSTIGTNICLSDGTILVDKVSVAEGGMIGHLAMLAPGSRIGERAEVGVGVAFGIRSRMGKDSKVGPGCVINHGVSIGDGAEVGTMSYVGIRASIGEGIKLPGGSNIPAGAVIKDKRDLDQYVSSETHLIRGARDRVAAIYEARVHAAQATAEAAVVDADGEPIIKLERERGRVEGA